MNLISSIVFLLSVLVLCFFWGCSENSTTTSPVLTDKEAIKQQVMTLDSVAEFSTSEEASLDDGSALSWDGDGLEKIASPILPLRWGRIIKDIKRSYEVVFSGDTAAIVTVIKTVTGELIILAEGSAGSTDPFEVKKAYQNTVRRRLAFRRIDDSQDRVRNWKPVALTPVTGETPENTFQIERMEMLTGQEVVGFTDWSSTWFRFGPRPGAGGLPTFRAGDSLTVRLVVQSRSQDREMALVRHSVHPLYPFRFRTRMVMTDSTTEGDVIHRTFEQHLVLRLPQGVRLGRFNLLADVLSRGTLFDDSAAVMNAFTGIPYIVTR